jgi:hypothetical protein
MHDTVPISKPPRDSALYRLQRSRRGLFDALALLIYLSIVYAWSLGLHPLGKDFEMLAGGGEGLPFLLRSFWELETALFGGSFFGYHVVNSLLLYGCMLALYRLARGVMPDRPVWLGTLAATLFMANPVHTDGVLHLSSATDLLPALAALTVLAAYATRHRGPSRMWLARSAALLCAGTLLFPSNLGLPAAALLYDWVLRGAKSNGFTVRALGLVALTAAALYVYREEFAVSGLDVGGMFAPLYFVFYPLGFLPETAFLFHEHPWTGWLAAATVGFILVLVWRKVRYPAFLFGIGAAACARLFQGDLLVDPVHLIGGGALLLPSALLTIALVSVFARMMDHPKWRHSVIGGTSILALVFFGLQIASINAWRHAGREVEAFQAKAVVWRDTAGDGVLGVLPDYAYYRGAPMMLSESIRFDTAFSQAVPYQSLLRLHYDLPGRLDVQWEAREDAELELRINHSERGPRATLLWPYILGVAGGVEEYGELTARAESITEETLTVVVRSEGGDLPEAIAP